MLTAETNEHKLYVTYDEYMESPRTWCNESNMYTWERNYGSPDKHNYSSPDDFLEDLKDDIHYGNVICLPVYRFEHSGIAYSTAAYGIPFDSGQVGFIYCYTDKHPESTPQEIEEMLSAQVEEYSKWANGEAKEIVLEKINSCNCCGHTTYEHITSIGGFLSEDIQKEISYDLFEDEELSEEQFQQLMNNLEIKY